jgi:hypothetical protein
VLWWISVSSLVSPILDTSGPNAFALVIGGRSVVELRGDGELRRTRLQSLLSGGSTTADFVRRIGEPLPNGYEVAAEESFDQWKHPAGYEKVKTSFGYRFIHDGERWVFVNGEYYLPSAAAQIRPSAIVDTSWPLEVEREGGHYEPFPGRFREFETHRLFNNRMVLVMPHTYRAENFLRRYVNWVQAGRIEHAHEWEPPPLMVWDPAAPPDPIRYTCPVPVQAEFGVTGLVQNGEWQDPSGLEAARSLLQARYDIKIGIWDLVENATLRRTLLESGPPNPAPVDNAAVPSAAAKRAESRVAGKMSERAALKKAWPVVAKHLKPLIERGWKRDRGVSWSLRLPFTDAVTGYTGGDFLPMFQLELIIGKCYSAVAAFTIMYNQVDIGKYVLARREIFEQIAAPDAGPLGNYPRPLLWRVPGGWADDIDWGVRAITLADRTPLWIQAFEELCDDCRRIFRPPIEI